MALGVRRQIYRRHRNVTQVQAKSQTGTETRPKSTPTNVLQGVVMKARKLLASLF